MFQDDRMISVLSGIVLMIAIGTVIQRADLVQDYFGSESHVVLNPDIVDARANRLLRIDVLKNDEGVAEADRKDLKLVKAPDCGRVFIQGEALQFLPDASCVGEQHIQYSLHGREDVVGEVVARMHSSDGERLTVATAETGDAGDSTDPKLTGASGNASDQPEQTEVALAGDAQPSPPAEDQMPVRAIGSVADDEGSLTSVVGSLIQGTAQPAQAGVASVEIQERQAAFERQAEAERQAEELRQAEILQQAEADRLAETLRQEEAERLAAIQHEAEAEAERRAEVRKRAEAARLAEIERRDEARRLAETQRQAEAERAAEAERQVATSSEPGLDHMEVAALGTPHENADNRVAVPITSAGLIARHGSAPEVTYGQRPDPAVAVKPGFSEFVPDINPVDPGEQLSFVARDDFDLAGVIGTDNTPARVLQSVTGSDISDFLVAVVERSEPSTVPPAAPSLAPAGDLADSGAPSGNLPSVEGAETRIALVDPVQEIVRPDGGLKPALNASPVDETQLPPGPNPVLKSILPPLKPSVIGNGALTDPEGNGGGRPSVTDAPAGLSSPSTEKLAALPQTNAPCVIPPAMTIDVRRAARSIVSVDAPCHANTIAELQYSGLRFAVPLDETGKGALTALGFEPNAPALLSFVNGEKIDFDLPFKGMNRVSRVAVVWDMPIELELNAIEFDGAIDGPDHVHPENPRGFADVRRSGGGFLDTYRGYAGVGQNAQIYTFWHRKGGRLGVVELMIDFASRNRDHLEGTCGDGIYSAPNFLILRSEDGRVERPVIRKLAAIDCSSVVQETGGKQLISGAVSDLVVLKR